MPIVEVRIPTYRRPQLLRRALHSLSSQTFSDWAAIVIDDSPEREAEAIVHEINDRRIIYDRHTTRMGAAGNLDLAFNPSPMLSGEFAFVLEDDNALLPSFIESNVSLMNHFGVTLMLRNQMIYEQCGHAWRDTNETTKSRLYNDRRLYSPIEIHATIFLSDCIANGGLFWRPGVAKTNFQVGDCVKDSGLQEFCRTAQINDLLLFAGEALAIWTRMPMAAALRSHISHQSFGRAIISLRRALIRKYKTEIVTMAKALADEKGLSDNLRLALMDSLYMPEVASALLSGEDAVILAKTLAKWLFVPDVIRGYELC